MFHHKVKQGSIPKVTPTGMKQGVYPKRDIDALTLSMNRGTLASDEPLFSRSSPADLDEEHLRHLWSLSNKRDLPFPSRLVEDRTAN